MHHPPLVRARSSLSRRPFTAGVQHIHRYSTNATETSSSVLLPYFIGGIGGIVAVTGGAYAYYHFSGAKKAVEKITAAKERYDDTKETVAEKGQVAREKLETMKDAAKLKAASLRDRWATRGSRGKGDEEP